MHIYIFIIQNICVGVNSPVDRDCGFLPPLFRESDRGRAVTGAANRHPFTQTTARGASWEIRIESSSGKIDSEPVSNLLRTPRPRPASLLAAPVPPTDPAHIWSRHAGPVSSGDDACESVLHILAQFVVRGELRDFRTSGAPVGVPLQLWLDTAGRHHGSQPPAEFEAQYYAQTAVA